MRVPGSRGGRTTRCESMREGREGMGATASRSQTRAHALRSGEPVARRARSQTTSWPARRSLRSRGCMYSSVRGACRGRVHPPSSPIDLTCAHRGKRSRVLGRGVHDARTDALGRWIGERVVHASRPRPRQMMVDAATHCDTVRQISATPGSLPVSESSTLEVRGVSRGPWHTLQRPDARATSACSA